MHLTRRCVYLNLRSIYVDPSVCYVGEQPKQEACSQQQHRTAGGMTHDPHRAGCARSRGSDRGPPPRAPRGVATTSGHTALGTERPVPTPRRSVLRTARTGPSCSLRQGGQAGNTLPTRNSMRCHPHRRVNHTKGTVFAAKTGARAALRVYLLRIDPLAHTGTVSMCVCSYMRPATPTTHTPPIWANDYRTTPHARRV